VAAIRSACTDIIKTGLRDTLVVLCGRLIADPSCDRIDHATITVRLKAEAAQAAESERGGGVKAAEAECAIIS
jgi:hypothetical protein